MLSENINLLKKEINKACLDADRDPKEITLMGASKSQTVENINLAYESGVSHFGENYLQEAELKITDAKPIAAEPKATPGAEEPTEAEPTAAGNQGALAQCEAAAGNQSTPAGIIHPM